MTIFHTTDATFKKDIKSKGYTLVNFWAPWCAPCRSLAPILETFAHNHSSEIKVLKVNVDEQSELPSKFAVKGLPTTILFKNGKQVEKIIGLVSTEKLQQFLSVHKK
ncbi:thioredoxin [Paenibacillus sp. SC116]|uniref:thioredoxin n=1 Tax=Paenibacillus sp. SC116 TaxID=2968986 RepID=UPI00215A9D2B|nr:thioredoxin [Paenibacillus sp. SC116]MCR8842363.1 thioredoxin [Paenibacillus sp. SC116]